MLCGIAFKVPMKVAGSRFAELQKLCTASGDQASLAIAMAGLVAEYSLRRNRLRRASKLASEAMDVAKSLAEPTLAVGLSAPLLYAKMERGEWRKVLQWSHEIIDLADGDPSKGNFIIGSPLAVAFATRAAARWHLGHDGWRTDMRQGLALARDADPTSYAMVVTAYMGGIPNGVVRPKDSVINEIEGALVKAERCGDDSALTITRVTLGLALVHHQTDAMRNRGQKLLAEVFRHDGYGASNSPIVEVCLARERARSGAREEAIALMRTAIDRLFREGRLAWSAATTGALVETLLDRGAENDVAEAEAAIERLVAAPGHGTRIRDIWLLRLRALLAQARCEHASYRELVHHYRTMAKSLGYEGHIEWADVMVSARPALLQSPP
jgi:hypothetical protein